MKRFFVGLASLSLFACAPATAPTSYFPYRDGETFSFDATYNKSRTQAKLRVIPESTKAQGKDQWVADLDQITSPSDASGMLVDVGTQSLVVFTTVNLRSVTRPSDAITALCWITSYKAGTRTQTLRGTSFLGKLSQFVDNPELALNAANPCSLTLQDSGLVTRKSSARIDQVDISQISRAIGNLER